MDSRFQSLGFAANYSSNAFKTSSISMQVGGAGAEYSADTILRLDSPGSSIPYMSASKGIKRKWSLIDGSLGQQIGSTLSLGLGRSCSSSDSKGSSATACTTMSSAKESDEESSMDLDLDFTLHLGNEKIPSPKKSANANMKGVELRPKVDLMLSLSTGSAESGITCGLASSSPLQIGMEMPLLDGGLLNADEGSTSCRWETGITLPPLQTSPNKEVSFFFNHVPRTDDHAASVTDLSSSVITTPRSSVTCTSGITQQHYRQQRSSSSKTCQIEGCGKGARGASGRCISHGGGRRCQKLGCHKGAEGRTVYCKAHGGGRRCEYLGCTKSAEGRTDYCIAHGGGRRCSHEGCTRAARGKSGLCIRHGGGKRCQKENCTKSAEGLSGLCISHGGGRRCQALGCTKGAQGSTMFCKAHGGGKRCTAPGCTKGAEGSTPFCKGHGGGKRCAFHGGGVCTKSVHGGTNFCVAHGGGKRCAIPECTKSARGRTDYCVRHGGGKRCKFEGCGKSAQGSTDFCKAHGGGKRCSWGHPGSEYGPQSSGPCNSFARGKTGLCALHSGLVQDKRVHGGFTLGPVIQDPKLNQPEKMKEVVTADEMNVDMMKMGSGLGTSAGRTYYTDSIIGVPNAGTTVGQGNVLSMSVYVPEGRVHGGSLMAMLAGGSGVSSSGSKVVAGDTLELGKSSLMPQGWM
ncbi:putative Transcription factor [Melia azedarach]|uniref:Transcription factor n=1 Tax=Melia azedarach TaxID=155640 RepID=A0ACC1XKX9_MELAZ|nr:putative Transcription factor [Melia azedarach]